MIGYPYGQMPIQHRMIFDGFGNPLGRCRLIAFPVPRRAMPMVPRMRLRFNFGEPEFAAVPPAFGAPVAQQQMLYDGLGNPVGIFPLIAALAAKVLPLAAQALPAILPGLRPRAPPAAPSATIPSPIVQMVQPSPTVVRPDCPPPTMEQCRQLYPTPVAPPVRRRRPRVIVRGR
jgi:hypothetical protein